MKRIRLIHTTENLISEIEHHLDEAIKVVEDLRELERESGVEDVGILAEAIEAELESVMEFVRDRYLIFERLMD